MLILTHSLLNPAVAQPSPAPAIIMMMHACMALMPHPSSLAQVTASRIRKLTDAVLIEPQCVAWAAVQPLRCAALPSGRGGCTCITIRAATTSIYAYGHAGKRGHFPDVS